MLNVLLIAAGLTALVTGAELLVRGACRLAARFGMSSLLVGLTVVAFGTSAPELAVSISSAASGQGDLAVGNAVGSNIFNVLLILGLSAIITPLVVDQKLIRFDVPLMIVVSLTMWLMSLDSVVQRTEGGILVAGLLAYLSWCVVAGRRESATVKREYEDAFGPARDTDQNSTPTPTSTRSLIIWQLGLIVAGLILLVLGAQWLVDGASELARRFGVSELAIGLTIVAGGTSLPELFTSVVAAIRGERDIAVGNVVGSNLFNIMGVLGISALVAPNGITVPQQALSFDIPVLIVVTVACLPVFFTGYQISRREGALFLTYGVAYTIAVLLLGTENPMFAVSEVLMLGFVLPLTLVTFVAIVRQLRQATRWRQTDESDGA